LTVAPVEAAITATDDTPCRRADADVKMLLAPSRAGLQHRQKPAQAGGLIAAPAGLLE